MDERALVRWGGEGVGQRRPLPEGLSGSVVGFPLVIGGDCVGAVLCLQVVPIVWDLVSQRALELVGEILGQVVTIAHMRFSMTAIQRGLAPVSIGLLLAGCLGMARGALTGLVTVLVAGVVFAALLRSRINPALLVLGGALAGLFALRAG